MDENLLTRKSLDLYPRRPLARGYVSAVFHALLFEDRWA